MSGASSSASSNPQAMSARWLTPAEQFAVGRMLRGNQELRLLVREAINIEGEAYVPADSTGLICEVCLPVPEGSNMTGFVRLFLVVDQAFRDDDHQPPPASASRPAPRRSRR